VAQRQGAIYFFGSASRLASCGLDCIPDGVSPWGLDADSPPDVVVVGPV